jgi:hypothetical protein
MKWRDVENTMCGQVQLAREIMHMLEEKNIPLGNDTVEALRLVANTIMDKVISI